MIGENTKGVSTANEEEIKGEKLEKRRHCKKV